MHKLNSNTLPEERYDSPKGKFACADRNLSVALGRDHKSTDLMKRHPFDVEICRIPKGKIICPYHSHSMQWEFYHVISGKGQCRDESGHHDIVPGDFFLYKPGEAHQLIAGAEEDLVVYVVADNPIGESCHYPDSGKWMVKSPEPRLIRSDSLEYHDGEE